MQNKARSIVVVMSMWIAAAAVGTSAAAERYFVQLNDSELVVVPNLVCAVCAVSDGTPACPGHGAGKRGNASERLPV